MEVSAFAAYSARKKKPAKPAAEKVMKTNKKSAKLLNKSESNETSINTSLKRKKKSMPKKVIAKPILNGDEKKSRKRKSMTLQNESKVKKPTVKRTKRITTNGVNLMVEASLSNSVDTKIQNESNVKKPKVKRTKKITTNGVNLVVEPSSSNSVDTKIQNESNVKKPTIKRTKKITTNGVNLVDEPSSSNSVDTKKSPSKSPKEIKKDLVIIAPKDNSIDEGLKVLEWILRPVDFKIFLKRFWENQPCLIQRDTSEYFSKLISFKVIDEMLKENHVEFTKNIDITSYENGERKTLNPDGRALPSTVWDFYSSGCSIRLLNPQTFIQSIYVMNESLQEFFHCMVGANVYLTPPNSQGFAPHYDDIEAFVLQIEGHKRWKLYNPRNEEEQLPRFSSGNFTQDEIGKPILDVVLKPGDVLYFPRGTIHQASTEPGYHSLHITLSVYQKHSYGDLFEILIPMMLSKAITENVQLRKGLPLNIWKNFGIVNSDNETNDREEILQKCHQLLDLVFKEPPIDQAVDQMAIRFQHDALPPNLNELEKKLTCFGNKTNVNKNGTIEMNFKMDLNSCVRLIRANILHIVEAEEQIRLYYYLDNSREYHEYEPNFLEIDSEGAIVVEHLIKSYPEFISVNDLQINDDSKLSIAQSLWDRGLLMTDKTF